jgi:D-alanyl-D-alanine carboxypeptidase
MKVFWTCVSAAFATSVVMGISGNAQAATFAGNSDTTGSLFARNSTNSVKANLADKLQASLDNIVRETGISGATVGIISPEGTWYGASGFSNLKNQTSMRPFDRFNIASVSKTFTAATVLSLVQEGRLSLEDKLDKWLPVDLVANIPNGRDITIRQLLNHTSGIPDYNFSRVIRDNPLIFYSRNWSPEELVALVKDLDPENAPGQGWYYSATNYILAALIVESATNSTFASQVRDRILDPLGLKDTFVRPQEPLPPDVVSGYLPATEEQLKALTPEIVQFLNNNFDFVDDQKNRRLYDAKLLLQGARGYGAGSVISTAADVAKFGDALFNGQLLKPEALKEMFNFIDT